MALLLLHLPTLALNSTFTLVYPLYSSYKAVTTSTTSLAEMQVWLVYWSVFACWTLFESLFGFLWSWVPFYYELRLLFNIWLVAPQTRGATYIYTNHLHPFLQTNQEAIDTHVDQLKRSARGKLDAYLGGLWSATLAGGGAGGQAQAPQIPSKDGSARHRPPGSGASVAGPPTQHNPAQASMSMFGNLVKTYAPLAVASARSFLESKAPPPQTVAYSIPSSASGDVNDASKRQAAMQRRRQLESQLAALDAAGVPSSGSSNSNDSDEVPGVAPVTLINPASGLRGSFGGQAGNQASLRNRFVSLAGARQTVKAGTAMGESYDLLEQSDIPPLQASPSSSGGAVGARTWIPWSPKSDN
ncbi:hypothetical protein NDA13_005965 [Ustilago tritici]|nr:hypothetical protein NDA13_005965 [Ustilago tritici]